MQPTATYHRDLLRDVSYIYNPEGRFYFITLKSIRNLYILEILFYTYLYFSAFFFFK